MEEPRYSKRNDARWEVDQVRFHLDKPLLPKRDVRNLADILPDVVKGLEIPEGENILILRNAWPELCGEQIARHSTPRFLKEFCLYVDVDHPGWLPELERIKRILLLKLQANYRMLKIRQLRFLLTHK